VLTSPKSTVCACRGVVGRVVSTFDVDKSVDNLPPVGVWWGVACGGVGLVSVSAMWRRGTLWVAAIVVANAPSYSLL
jgi:hypothetical protein